MILTVAVALMMKWGAGDSALAQLAAPVGSRVTGELRGPAVKTAGRQIKTRFSATSGGNRRRTLGDGQSRSGESNTGDNPSRRNRLVERREEIQRSRRSLENRDAGRNTPARTEPAEEPKSNRGLRTSDERAEPPASHKIRPGSIVVSPF
ncbi:hypothetical protein HQ520_14620 [bacterium]|nr:hypothetical protein [bacterium]